MTDGQGGHGKYVIRRLTPVETERLQGFPDNWTDLSGCDIEAVTKMVAASLGYDESRKKALRTRIGKWSRGHSDSPRYKATGNSFAIPVIRWIGERIQMVEDMSREDGGASDGR